MVRVRIPGWWLSVGPDTAFRIQEVFTKVMAELPMSHAELATRLKKMSPSTVTRWANGKTTPEPEMMLRAVEEARADLERKLEQASLAQKALTHLVAAEEAANTAGRSSAGWKEAPAIDALLEGVVAQPPGPEP